MRRTSRGVREVKGFEPANSRGPAYTWRRLHGGNIIAEVSLSTGMGLWRVCAYRVGGGVSEVAYTGRAYSLLTEAQLGADRLVQEHFVHACETGVCGKWLRWRET